MRSIIVTSVFMMGFIVAKAQSNPVLFVNQLGFVENKGQVINQFGEANKCVKYIYADKNFNLQLKKDGFSYEMFKDDDALVFAEASLRNEPIPHYSSETNVPAIFHSHRIDVTIEGADLNTVLIPEEPSLININFYTPNTGTDGITGVQSYHRIIYKNVYPLVDLVFSVSENQEPSLKYEWFIREGGNTESIKLKYAGAISLKPDDDCNYNVQTSLGNIYETGLNAFTADDRTPVMAEYFISSNTVSYHLGSKVDKPIVIDPNISWFSFFGGTLDEDIYESEMSLDQKGNPIFTGNTSSTQYIASTGAFQTTYGGSLTDAFIAKFKPDGKLSWCTYYGSAQKDGGHSIACNSTNDIYVGGNTYGSSNIATAGSYQSVFGGSMDAFLVKFNTNGFRYWATYYGGEGFGDQINGLACDDAGNIFFAGYTGSYNNIATAGALQDTLNGDNWYSGDVMLGEFTSGGKLVWCTYYSGPGQDRAQSLALGKGSDLYVQGTCSSTKQFATSGAHQIAYGGGSSDGWISKWDTTGHLYWCSYYGGEAEEHGRNLQIDSNGDAYIAGWTNSLLGMASDGAFQDTLNLGDNGSGINNPDGYLAKFHSDGSLAWSTYYGGKADDRARGLSVDENANEVYLSGSTGSHSNVATDGGLFQETIKETDGFLVKFTGDGERVWAYYVGGIGNQIIFDTEIDKKNFIYLYMITDSVFSTPAGVYQAKSNGGEEVLLVKVNLSDSCFDGFEPNNSSITAKNISTSSDPLFYGYNAVIPDAADVDWLRISIPATNLKIELTDLADDYDLFLYKNNGYQILKSSINSGTTDETIIFNNIPQRKYLIKVVHNGSPFQPASCYRLIPRTGVVPWILKNSASGIQHCNAEVFPNPCSDFLTIKISTDDLPDNLTIRLLDQVNDERMRSSVQAGEGLQNIGFDVRFLPSGIYYLEFKSDKDIFIKKVVIQK